MNNVTIIDHLPRFGNHAQDVFDDALRSAAKDVLINAKDKAPYAKGGLRSNSDTHKIKPLLWRISFWIEYARYQELGGDARHVIRNYSTPGTGKGFLKKSGDEQVRKLKETLRKHAGRVRA